MSNIFVIKLDWKRSKYSKYNFSFSNLILAILHALSIFPFSSPDKYLFSTFWIRFDCCANFFLPQCTNGHLMCAGCFIHLLADSRLKEEQATCPNCRYTKFPVDTSTMRVII